MSAPDSKRDLLPAPRWLLWLTLVVSAVLHASFGFTLHQVFSTPPIDIEFELPMDVELGLSDEVAMAPVAPPRLPLSPS